MIVKTSRVNGKGKTKTWSEKR